MRCLRLLLWSKPGRDDGDDDGRKTCDLEPLPKEELVPNEELENSPFREVPEEQEEDENLYS